MDDRRRPDGRRRHAGRDPDDLTICVAAPAYVTDDVVHARDQCRWFGGMVGNHVADIVARYGEDAPVPKALTDYIKGREGYDYNEHGQAGNVHTQFVPDEIVDRFCVLGPVEEHVRRLQELKSMGVHQFAVYLQHDDKDGTLQAYGEKVIPAIADSGAGEVVTGRTSGARWMFALSLLLVAAPVGALQVDRTAGRRRAASGGRSCLGRTTPRCRTCGRCCRATRSPSDAGPTGSILLVVVLRRMVLAAARRWPAS